MFRMHVARHRKRIENIFLLFVFLKKFIEILLSHWIYFFTFPKIVTFNLKNFISFDSIRAQSVRIYDVIVKEYSSEILLYARKMYEL